MDYRLLGKTGLKVSVLGFGCGNVGGIMVRGEHKDMVRVVSRAIEAGVTYFDTAPLYGNGVSETNLGRVLKEIGAAVYVGTKVWLTPEDMDNIAGAVTASVNQSLRRLGTESVDLIQLHNRIGTEPKPGAIGIVCNLRDAPHIWCNLRDAPHI